MTQAALAGLAKAIDELFAGGAEACADEGSVVELHRQLVRLEAVVTGRAGRGQWVSGAGERDQNRQVLAAPPRPPIIAPGGHRT